MVTIFKVFRFLGFLPFKLTKNDLQYCPKWHIYSYITAASILIIIFRRAFVYTEDSLDGSSPNFIYDLLMKYEPLIVCSNVFTIYCSFCNKKNTKIALKIVTKLKMSSRKGSKSKAVFYTLTSLIISFILVMVYYSFYLDHYAITSSMLDILVAYLGTFIITIHILQLCLYFEGILKAYSELEKNYLLDSNLKMLQPLQLHPMFLKISKLRSSKNKMCEIYHPTIVYLELNCLVYCIFVYRGAYDVILREYTTIIPSVIIVLWSLIDIPLQFYLMHLNEVLDTRVSFVLLVYLVFVVIKFPFDI